MIRIINVDDMMIPGINNPEGLSVTASFSGLKRENKNHSLDMENVLKFPVFFFKYFINSNSSFDKFNHLNGLYCYLKS